MPRGGAASLFSSNAHLEGAREPRHDARLKRSSGTRVDSLHVDEGLLAYDLNETSPSGPLS